MNTNVLVGGKKREDVLADRKREFAEKLANQQDCNTPAENPPSPMEPQVSFHGEGWTLSPIKLAGKYYEYDLKIGLLDIGKRSFPEWVKYSRDASASGDYYAMAADELLSITEFLLKHISDPTIGKDDEKALFSMRRTLQSIIEFNNTPCFLSKGSYGGSSGIDFVTHGVGTPNERPYLGNLRGNNGLITDLSDGNAYCKMVFGNPDAKRVDFILLALSGKKPYAIRMDPSHEHLENSMGMWSKMDLNIGAVCKLDYKGNALGVRQIREIIPPLGGDRQ